MFLDSFMVLEDLDMTDNPLPNIVQIEELLAEIQAFGRDPIRRSDLDRRIHIALCLTETDIVHKGHLDRDRYLIDTDAALLLARRVLPHWQLEQVSWESEPGGGCFASMGNFGTGDAYACGMSEVRANPATAITECLLEAVLLEHQSRRAA